MAGLTGRSANTNDSHASERTQLLCTDTGDEEPPLPASDDQSHRTDSDIESDFDKRRRDLEQRPDDIVRPRSWRDRLAEFTVNRLIDALFIAFALSEITKAAYKKARNATTEFVKNHIAYVTVVALGILVLVAWGVVGPLGFGGWRAGV